LCSVVFLVKDACLFMLYMYLIFFVLWCEVVSRVIGAGVII